MWYYHSAWMAFVVWKLWTLFLHLIFFFFKKMIIFPCKSICYSFVRLIVFYLNTCTQWVREKCFVENISQGRHLLSNYCISYENIVIKMCIINAKWTLLWRGSKGSLQTVFHYVKLNSVDKSSSSNTRKRKKNNIHDFIWLWVSTKKGLITQILNYPHN